MFLTRLIYFSVPNFKLVKGSPDPVLMSILKAGLKNNTPNMITGSLTIDSGYFVQLLEGPRDEISDTFKRIVQDRRHRDIQLLNMEEIPKRIFDSFIIAINNDDDLPSCEPRQMFMEHMTADSIVERIRRVSETGIIAERRPSGSPEQRIQA